jgi:hypothetical protein
MSTTTRESRLPELHLPEITREGIARGLSEIHAPDLSKIERPNIEMPDIDLSAIDLRRDVGKAVTNAAVALGIVRPQRPRWPFVVAAAIIAGLTGWALMRSTTFRDRLDRAMGSARVRLDEMREAHEDREEALEPVAFTAAETAPIKPGKRGKNGSPDVAEAFDAADAVPNDYPKGLGATTDQMDAALDGAPVFEKVDARN